MNGEGKFKRKNKSMKKYKKLFIFWAILFVAGTICWILGLDKKILAVSIVTYGLLTQIFGAIFSAIGAWIMAIPAVGPLMIKVIMWPLFLLINALAYLVTLLRIKKDKPSSQLTTQAMATVLSIGILIGYILSKVF